MAYLDRVDLTSATALAGVQSQNDLRVALKWVLWKLFHEYKDVKILHVKKLWILSLTLYVRDLESLLIATCGPDPYRKGE